MNKPAAMLALLMVLSGCGDGTSPVPACGTGGVRLSVRDSGGQAVFPFRATADRKSAGWTGIDCESGDAADGCGGPLVFGDTAEGAVITIRTPGYANMAVPADYDTPPDQDLCHAMTATLLPLGGFAATEDYRTGFSETDGIEAFKALAAATTSTTGNLSSVKFYIDDLDGNPTVYFQNTRKNPLHYDFVRVVLGRSVTMDEYEAATYHGEDRTAMAGTLVYYDGYPVELGDGTTIESPITVEFFPSDDLTPAQALRAYDLILERMQFLMPFGPSNRLVYVPATADHETGMNSSGNIFERTGALWVSRETLLGNVTMQLMNRGVAYGRLLKLTPEELEKTVVSWKDIVLLTRLPIEAPLVGGFITGELQTPLAHVNVAAMNRGTPNMALVGASEDERVKPYIWPGTGGDGSGIVRYEVTREGFSLEWSTLADAEAYWAEMRPTDLEVPEADVTTEGLPAFADLDFTDSTMVGAKAANLAECRKVLGDMVPDGFAVPFHYYQTFVDNAVVGTATCRDARDDCIKEGRDASVCIEVCDLCETGDGLVLSDYMTAMLADGTFIADAVFREAALDGLRYLFGHIPVDATFATLIDGRVSAKFGSTPVRMRSSTNAEDLAEFSGAGLYESVTGNTPDQVPYERIRKVWASVWNWRAFEERSFMGLVHTDVKMGVAVHHSFPNELANGVLITRNLLDPAVDGYYVNVQKGETSVTNPEDGSLPEIFSMAAVGGEVKVTRTRYSSLSDDEPLMTDQEITALYVAARKLHDHFLGLYKANPMTFALDIEFKLDSPDRKLAIKQARPYSWSP